jgi:hypothetical protein
MWFCSLAVRLEFGLGQAEAELIGGLLEITATGKNGRILDGNFFNVW